MKATKTILKEWAKKILSNVLDYDFEETASLQYGDNNEWEKFFVEMAHSKGWDKIRKEQNFENEEAAQFYMMELLDQTIEETGNNK